MKKMLAFAAASIAAGMFSLSAQAGTVNFADYAAGNEHGINSGDSVTIDGVAMTFVSAFHPYFDDVSSGKPAGLGVCRELNATMQCADSSDDSVDGELGVDETIEIFFDAGPYDLMGISFRDGEHNLINDSLGMLDWYVSSYMGGSTQTTTFAAYVALAVSGAFLGADAIGFRYEDTEFYIEYISDVPLPAALPLLLSGIAGLGFASRRKKRA